MRRFPVQILLFVIAVLSACVQFAAAQGAVPPAGLPTPAPQRVSFDALRAFEHVRQQVAFGPRPAGSAANQQMQEYLIAQLKSYGLKVTTQPFQPNTPQGIVPMRNIIGELPGDTSDVIIICSHFDTKFFPNFKFVGANDGGSSTGVVLELARVLAQGQRFRHTLQFVFFDGEEAFCPEWDECLQGRDHTYGSQYFADQLQQHKQVARTKAVILLDMVGDKQLRLERDTASTGWLTELIWRTGAQLGYDRYFVNRSQDVGGDDHYPFLQVGVPAVDLIHFASTWHTPHDTLEQISPQSLKVVGETVQQSLPLIEAKILGTK